MSFGAVFLVKRSSSGPWGQQLISSNFFSYTHITLAFDIGGKCTTCLDNLFLVNRTVFGSTFIFRIRTSIPLVPLRMQLIEVHFRFDLLLLRIVSVVFHFGLFNEPPSQPIAGERLKRCPLPNGLATDGQNRKDKAVTKTRSVVSKGYDLVELVVRSGVAYRNTGPICPGQPKSIESEEGVAGLSADETDFCPVENLSNGSSVTLPRILIGQSHSGRVNVWRKRVWGWGCFLEAEIALREPIGGETRGRI